MARDKPCPLRSCASAGKPDPALTALSPLTSMVLHPSHSTVNPTKQIPGAICTPRDVQTKAFLKAK